MERIAAMHPILDERYRRPGMYWQTAYLLFAITPLVAGITSRVLTILPLLVMLAVSYPLSTAGNVNDDYGQAFPILAMPLAFLDFFVLTPLQGEDVRLEGQLSPATGKGNGTGEEDCDTSWEKLKWGVRLATTMRGIGWNWQVKGVPQHPNSRLRRFDFVVQYFILAVLSWSLKFACHYFIGVATGGKLYTDNLIAIRTFDVIIGWSGACWAYHGLNCYYRLGAAVSVAVGLCDQWEWPPLFGPLSDAWSVRQMWR